MSVSHVPARLLPSSTSRLPIPVWIPVLIGLGVICVESTRFMGGNTTQKMIADVWQAVVGRGESAYIGPVNHYLRKVGHVTGYGTLSLLFRRAWYVTIRAYMAIASHELRIAVVALSVVSTLLVGSLDEWHQSFVPGRISAGIDVLIDTCGALLFNVVFWMVLAHRRRMRSLEQMPRLENRLVA
jgi:VanZ family protein